MTSVPEEITDPGAVTMRTFVKAWTVGVLSRSATVGSVCANTFDARSIRESVPIK
jgi:hypothetical protein